MTNRSISVTPIRAALPIAAVCGWLAQAAPAQATSLATYVAATGTDSGACTAAAPCRTFQFAHGQTTAGGIIHVLTPGSYGPVNITKSITILSEAGAASIQSGIACPGGGRAGVCVSNGNVIRLQGLTIDVNAANQTNGIRVNFGAELRVQNTTIRRAGAVGILFASGVTTSKLFVSNSTVANSLSDAIRFQPTGSGPHTAAIDEFRGENNGGSCVQSFSTTSATFHVTVRNSICAGNVATAVGAIATGDGAINVMVDHTTMATNASTGVGVSGTNAVARVAYSSITGSDAAFVGNVVSFGNNAVAGNGGNETPGTTIPLK